MSNYWHRLRKIRQAPLAAPLFQGRLQTRRQCLSVFKARVGAELAAVLGQTVYVDTIGLWMPVGFSKSEISMIEAINWPGRVTVRRAKGPPGARSVRIHQPRKATILYCHRKARSYSINRLDFALDLMTADRKTAMTLSAFIGQHVRQKWHGRRSAGQYGNTFYASQPWRRRNIAVYGTKPSKATGQACAHVEVRYFGSAACATLGPINLPDLIGWNVAPTFEHNFSLSTLVPAQVMKKLNLIASATLRWSNKNHTVCPSRAQVISEITRRICRAIGTTPAQALNVPILRWCEIPWWKPSDVIEQVRADALIKSPTTLVFL